MTQESPDVVDMARYSPTAYGSPWRAFGHNEYEHHGTVKYWRPLTAPCPPADMTAEVERLRAEVARLEAKSKALRAECSDLWEVIERTKDALRDYDGICLEGAQGAWEILQGALDEEPNNAS